MTDMLITRLEDEMRKQGFNYKSLSRAAGLGETSVRDIITRRAINPRRDTLQKIAVTLGKPLSYFLAEDHEATVKVVGELGHSATLAIGWSQQVGEPTSAHDELDKVETPPELGYRNLVALRVKGDRLLPFMPHGTLVYYSFPDENRESCLNMLCIVQVKNGAAMLRFLKPGTYYGTYNLQDYVGGVIENAEVEWCAKVRFVRLP